MAKFKETTDKKMLIVLEKEASRSLIMGIKTGTAALEISMKHPQKASKQT